VSRTAARRSLPHLLGSLASTLALLAALLVHTTARAALGAALQMQLGNPSNAAADSANHTHYLIQRAQYALDYNDTTHEPNWVAWDLTSDDVGGSGRSPDFYVDPTLPTGFYRVLTTDYSGSGYDRGHMCPSADRTVTSADNQFTFYMSNMVPQSPDNNQGVWASFETYCRTLAAAGNELLITSGPSGLGATTLASGVAVPGYTWKIAVVVPTGAGAAVDRITAATRVIALKIPNIAGVRSNPWQQYITSVAQLETDTGFTFFSALPAAVAATLRTKTDDQSVVGAPRIITQPAAQAVSLGGTATFSVAATGDAPLTYQWSFNGDDIAGATSATLSITNAQAASVGDYAVAVTNALGSVTSNTAALTLGSAADSGSISWDFSSATPSSGLPAGVAGGTVTQGSNNGTTSLLTSVSVASGYTGVSGGNNAGAAARTGALNQTATTGSAYFEFTLTPAAGRQLVVSALSFGTRSTSTGPQAFAIFTSIDHFTTPFASGPLANNSAWTLIAPTFSAFAAPVGTAVTFRLYGYNGTGSPGPSTANWRIDDLKLGVTAVGDSATAPVITRQPGNVTVVAGGSATLTAAATGTPTPTFQWSKDGVAIDGATNATLALPSVTTAQAGAYSVVITNSARSVTSDVATLTVLRRSYAGYYFGSIVAAPGTASPNGGAFVLVIRDDNTGVFLGYERIPAFLSDLPAGGYVDHTRTYVSRDVAVDANGAFDFAATSYIPTSAFRGGVTPGPGSPPSPPLTLARVSIRGGIADNGTLTGQVAGSSTLTATKSADTGATAGFAGFYVAGAASTPAQVLTAISPAGQTFVVAQTSDAIDAGGGTITSAGTAAVATFGQQIVNLSCSTTTGLLTATLPAASGALQTFSGLAETAPAIAGQRLANLSSRAIAGTGDQVAIVGFVIAGLESKTVLVRAIGPTLRTFGVATAVGAPRLDVMSGATLVATNTGWGTAANAAEIAAASPRVGAFALAAGSADSVVLTTLAPGNYTALVSAADGNAGAALVEVYDVSGGTLVQKLSNLSTRAFAGTDDNTLIAGVVVNGSVPKRVLVRAAGPALVQFGLTSALARPQLTLYAGATPIATNTDWNTSADAATLAAAAVRVGAFAFSPTSADSALIINLAPGSYTAQVTGVGGTTGTALIEIYELP
jgi:DNA/RNA endonuclease G (NUC1)